MMFNHRNFFVSLTPWNKLLPIQHVTIADGHSKAQISGIGTARFLINNKHCAEFKNALFAPSLSTHLFSFKKIFVIRAVTYKFSFYRRIRRNRCIKVKKQLIKQKFTLTFSNDNKKSTHMKINEIKVTEYYKNSKET